MFSWKKQSDSTAKITINPLTPEVIADKDSNSYKTVREISAAIDHKDVKNIAVTGPYGSGKSSILKTLVEDFKENRKFLSISLATLKSGLKDKEENKENSEHTPDKTPGPADVASKENEELNRKIEYSIVQQLIYRESTDDLPNSRIKKIVHTKPVELFWKPLACIGFILALWKLFSPTWLIIDTLTKEIPELGEILIDVFCLLYVLTFLYCCIRGLIKSYSNSKLNKLNLKDGEIEIKENSSIFNKHLDEIIYFFQATKYDIVIIEDLDRYETTDIFLKLRELNLILNNAYSTIGRKITFIYAIRDDMFKDTDRTKFFDYIATVIPVINYSNSKDKLTEALRNKGYKVGGENRDFEIDEIEDIAFFIDDMRLLKNIVNEFHQYWEKLGTNGSSHQLKPAKLLAMITYKNFFPEEFVKLHKREGRLYNCICHKEKYIEYALKTIADKVAEINKEEDALIQTIHLAKDELRSVYAEKVRVKIRQHHSGNIYLSDNKNHTLDEVLSDFNLFMLMWSDDFYYTHDPRYYAHTKSLLHKADIERSINSQHSFLDRLAAIQASTKGIEEKKHKLEIDLSQIRSKTIAELCRDFAIHNSKEYISSELEAIESIFIQNGYIGEDYYDYISYFYDDLMSPADHDFILAVKIDKPLDYNYHLDKPRDVVKNMRLPLFRSRSALNFDLIDHLITDNCNEEKLNILIETIKNSQTQKDFLEDYYNSSANPFVFFTKLYDEHKDWLWPHCVRRANSGNSSLMVAYFMVCDKMSMTADEIEWLNDHFDLIEILHSQMDIADFNELIKDCCFTDISNKRKNLVDYIISNNLYQINTDNLIVIASHLGHTPVSEDDLTLTRMLGLNNSRVSDYLLGNLGNCITQLSDKAKNESTESLLIILNDSNIAIDNKQEYLAQQENTIGNISLIDGEDMIDLAIEVNILAGSWDNTTKYFSNYKWNDSLNKYIANRATEIGKTDLIVSENIDLINHILNNASIPTLREIAGSISEYAFNKLEGLEDFDDKEIHRLLNGGFSTLQKQSIIDLCNIQAIANSKTNSDIVADVYMSSPWEIDPDKIFAVSGNISELKKKTQLFTVLIKEKKNSELIAKCITLLPEEYHAIAEKRRQPKIVNNEYNLEFIKALNVESYISSYSIKDDKIHVVTKYN